MHPNNNKLHICIFSAQYMPHMGGIENFTYNLSKALIHKGYKVTVITSNTDGLKTKNESEQIQIIRLPIHNFIQGRYPIINHNKLFTELKKEIYKEKFDFVIVNARFYIHSIFGLRMAYKRKIPAICIDHGTSHLTVNNKLLDFIGGLYEHLITKIDKCYCKNYYAVSPTSLAWLRHFKITGKGILYNSIDPCHIENIQKINCDSYREKYHLSQNDFILTFTGRLLAEKGLPQLVKAVENLVKTYPNLHLMIAGEGPLKINTPCKNIHLLGRIDFNHVIHLLGETNIFILPSDSEGFSTSILEAGMCSCYIIANDTGGIRDVLRDNEYGIVMDDNSEASVRKAIITAINRRPFWNKAEELTKNNILSRFTWDSTADDVIEIINKMRS